MTGTDRDALGEAGGAIDDAGEEIPRQGTNASRRKNRNREGENDETRSDEP